MADNYFDNHWQYTTNTDPSGQQITRIAGTNLDPNLNYVDYGNDAAAQAAERGAFVDQSLPAEQQMLAQLQSSRDAVQTPAAQVSTVGQTTLSGAPQQQFGDRQTAFLNALHNHMYGTGQPSAAQTQLQQGLQAANAQQRALALSSRGINPALAMRQAAQGQAANAQQTAQTGAQLGAQDQLAAQNMYGQALGAARDQNQNFAFQQALLNQQMYGVNANLANQVGQANLNSAVQSQSQKDAMDKYYTESGLALDASQFAANQAYGQMKNNQQQNEERIKSISQQANTQRNVQLASGAIQAVGTAARAASDKRLKTNISDGQKDVSNFMDAITAYRYRYKDPRDGAGTYVSPMAQDLERTTIGKSMVVNTPRGKMVDYSRGFGAMLAALAEQHHRIKELERSK